MTLIRDNPDQFSRLIDASAERRQLDPGLVEKDYWAVEALRTARIAFDVPIGSEAVHVQPVFKGGTSLSKAFGLIERFSEDIDLLVPLPLDDPTAYSQNQRAAIMRAVTDAVGAALGIEGERKAGRRGVDYHWLYPYPAITAAAVANAVEPHIVVEVTVMGGQNPQTAREVTSMVGEHASTIIGFPVYDDLSPVPDVPTLGAERTLIEKLAMVHNSASQALEGNERRLQGAGRHFYDIAKLLQSPQVRSHLSAGWTAQIAADADSWSAKGNFPHTPRPEDGFAASPAFTDATLAQVVEASYQAAMTWVWGERPSLDECVTTVAQHAELL